MDNEEWRDLVGYAGYYMISSFGRVYSVRRKKMLKCSLSDGYPSFSASVNGKVKRIGVHRAVLRAFVGPPPEGMESLHKDGNKLNPRLDNLHYGTRGENVDDQVRHGVHRWANQETCPKGHSNWKLRRKKNGRVRRVCYDCKADEQRRRRRERARQRRTQ